MARMAADAIFAARPGYSDDELAAYRDRIEKRFGPRGKTGVFGSLPGWARDAAARVLFGSAWLTRRVLLEDAFLHVRRAQLA